MSYVCEKCGVTFTRSYNLQRHNRESCGFRFANVEYGGKRVRVAGAASSSGMRNCAACNVAVPANQMAAHQRSAQHKNNSCTPLSHGIEIVSSAFKSRIVTYRVTSDSEHIDYSEFFASVKGKVLSAMGDLLRVRGALKVNMVVVGRYFLQAQDTVSDKSFNTRNEIATVASDLDDMYQSFVDAMKVQSTEFQEKDSGRPPAADSKKDIIEMEEAVDKTESEECAANASEKQESIKTRVSKVGEREEAKPGKREAGEESPRKPKDDRKGIEQAEAKKAKPDIIVGDKEKAKESKPIESDKELSSKKGIGKGIDKESVIKGATEKEGISGEKDGKEKFGLKEIEREGELGPKEEVFKISKAKREIPGKEKIDESMTEEPKRKELEIKEPKTDGADVKLKEVKQEKTKADEAARKEETPKKIAEKKEIAKKKAEEEEIEAKELKTLYERAGKEPVSKEPVGKEAADKGEADSSRKGLEKKIASIPDAVKKAAELLGAETEESKTKIGLPKRIIDGREEISSVTSRAEKGEEKGIPTDKIFDKTDKDVPAKTKDLKIVKEASDRRPKMVTDRGKPDETREPTTDDGRGIPPGTTYDKTQKGIPITTKDIESKKASDQRLKAPTDRAKPGEITQSTADGKEQPEDTTFDLKPQDRRPLDKDLDKVPRKASDILKKLEDEDKEKPKRPKGDSALESEEDRTKKRDEREKVDKGKIIPKDGTAISLDEDKLKGVPDEFVPDKDIARDKLREITSDKARIDTDIRTKPLDQELDKFGRPRDDKERGSLIDKIGKPMKDGKDVFKRSAEYLKPLGAKDHEAQPVEERFVKPIKEDKKLSEAVSKEPEALGETTGVSEEYPEEYDKGKRLLKEEAEIIAEKKKDDLRGPGVEALPDDKGVQPMVVKDKKISEAISKEPEALGETTGISEEYPEEYDKGKRLLKEEVEITGERKKDDLRGPGVEGLPDDKRVDKRRISEVKEGIGVILSDEQLSDTEKDKDQEKTTRELREKEKEKLHVASIELDVEAKRVFESQLKDEGQQPIQRLSEDLAIRELERTESGTPIVGVPSKRIGSDQLPTDIIFQKIPPVKISTEELIRKKEPEKIELEDQKFAEIISTSEELRRRIEEVGRPEEPESVLDEGAGIPKGIKKSLDKETYPKYPEMVDIIKEDVPEYAEIPELLKKKLEEADLKHLESLGPAERGEEKVKESGMLRDVGRPVSKCRAICNLVPTKQTHSEIELATIDHEDLLIDVSDKEQQIPEIMVEEIYEEKKIEPDLVDIIGANVLPETEQKETEEGRILRDFGRPMGECRAKCNLVPTKGKESGVEIGTIDHEDLLMDMRNEQKKIPEIKDQETFDEKEIKTSITDIIGENVLPDSKDYTESEKHGILDDKVKKQVSADISEKFLLPSSKPLLDEMKSKKLEISTKRDLTIPLDIRQKKSDSYEVQKEPILLDVLKDEATETKRADHKCMAACRNAKERPTVFGEETGGIVLGTDTETPHDLVPPGYYMPDDMTPRSLMPQWADIPKTTLIQQDSLSLSETTVPTKTESDKAIWIVPKPEEEILEAPKDKSIPRLEQEWETDTETFAEDQDQIALSEEITMGNVLSRVLSGQVVGLPLTSPLMDNMSPQTLSEAIYQQKLSSKTCRAYCAKKKLNEDAVEEEPLETVEDVSDINTDSEIAEEFYDSQVVPDTVEESFVEALDQTNLNQTPIDDLYDKIKLDETAAVEDTWVTANSYTNEFETLDEAFQNTKQDQQILSADMYEPADEMYATIEDVNSELESIKEGNDLKEVTKLKDEMSEQFETARDALPIEIDVAQDIEKENAEYAIDKNKSEELAKPNNKIISAQGKETKKSVIIEEPILAREAYENHLLVVVPPRDYLFVSEITSLSSEDQSGQIQEDEYVDAQSTLEIVKPTQSKHTADVIHQTSPVRTQSVVTETVSKSREVSVETVPKKSYSKYVEAIEKMPPPKQETSAPRFANWFSPLGFSKPIQEKPICSAKCNRASNTKSSIKLAHKSVSLNPSTSNLGTSTEPVYRQTQKCALTTTDSAIKLEKCLQRLATKPPTKICEAKCAKGSKNKDEENQLLRDELEAKEAYCVEQRKIATAALEQLENIKNIVEERDDLRKKLQTSQYELADLKKNLESLGYGDTKKVDTKKSNVYVPFKESDSSLTNSCDEGIKLLEDEIKEMRTSCLTPDQETKVIKKEVEVLKRYCAKLSSIQEENASLKKCNQELQQKCLESEAKLKTLGVGDRSTIDDIQERLLTLNETIAERNVLQNRVDQLANELNAYHDLPEDIEVFKRRSILLDDVLKDRDRLAKRVEQMRGIDDEIVSLKLKAERVDELERQLRLSTKDIQAAEDELDSMRNKCTMAEIELLNQKTEADTLRSKIVCMEHETESLKSMCKEQELLQIEKERLQASLDELVRMQDDYEHMCIQMKSLDVLKAEKDRYKRKYEELVGLESECNMLREQLDKTKIVEREKDALERQTEDLEKCICEQEDEIRRLVGHIDCLAQGKEEQQHKMKEVVSNLKIELDKKESLLVLSEGQMSTMRGKIDSSFHDLSEETKNLRERNKYLDKEISALKSGNTDLQNKLNKTVEKNASLVKKLEDKNRVIETMQEVLKDRETCQVEYETTVYNSVEITRLQDQLEAANFENQQLQQLAAQPGNTNQKTDQQLRDMLAQSKTAVERIALELEQQYADWDCKKRYRCCPGCTCKQKDNKVEPKVIIRCCAGCNCKNKTKNKNTDKTEIQRGYEKACQAKSADSSPRCCSCKRKPVQLPEDSPMEHHLCQCRKRKEVATICHTCHCRNKTDAETEPKENSPRKKTCLCKIFKDNATDPRSWDCKCIGIGSTDLKDWNAMQAPSDTEGEMDEDQMYTARSVEESKAKIEELENELSKANDTIIQLRERIATNERLAAENSALRRHSTEVQEVAKDQIEDLIKHLKKAKDRVEEVEAKNCKLKFNLHKCMKRLRDQGTQEEILDTLNMPDVNTLNKLQADLEECLKEKERLLKLTENLKQQLTVAQKGENLPDLAAFAQLKTDLEDCLKEKEKLIAEIKALKQILETSTAPESEIFSKLKADLEACLKEKEVLLKMIDNLRAELEKCLKEKETLSEIIDSLQKQVASGTTEDLPDMVAFAKLKAELDDCLKEKESLSKSIDSLQKQREPSTTEDKLRSDLENCLKENENLLKQINDLKQQLASSETQNQYNIDNLRAELEKCLKEKEALSNIIDNLQKQLASGATEDMPDIIAFAKLKADLENCLQEKENLLKQINDLKQQLASKTQDQHNIDNLRAELEKCLKEKEDLSKTINSMQKQLASGITEDLPDMTAFANLKSELENCLKEKENLLKQIDALKQQVASDSTKNLPDMAEFIRLKSELENCLREKENLMILIDDLKKQLSSNQPDLIKLRAQLEDCLKEKQKLLGTIDELQKQLAVAKMEDRPDMASFAKLKSELEKCLKEKDDLLKMIHELQIGNDQLKKEKDDLDKMLMSNVVVTSRRSSKLENDLDTFSNQNKKLTADNEKLNQVNNDLQNKNRELLHQLAALQSENDRLKMELAKLKEKHAMLQGEVDNLRQLSIDPAVLDALKKENENLKKQLENQKKEMKELLEKINQPSTIPPMDKLLLDKDQQDKDAMQAIINDLEKQLRNLTVKEKDKSPEPSIDLKKKLDELAKQLEEAQKRAEAAENTIRHLKASDPTAMLNAEMQKLKERLAQLEKENSSLRDALSQANNDKVALKKDLDNALNDAKKIKQQNDALQRTVTDLRSENDNLKVDLQKMKDDASGDSILKAENDKLKKRIAQLERDIEDFKKELEHAYTDTKKSADGINQLINENGDLRKKMAQTEGENSKLKKEMEAALADAKKNADKLLELEKDNAKCKQTVKDLENEVARLKKELDNMLNDAKKNANTISDLQKEIAALKQKIAQLESVNAKLDDENSKVKKELAQARGGSQAVASLQDENNKLRQHNDALQLEIDKLKKDLENALADAKSKLATATRLQDEVGNLKKRLQQLEAENSDLENKLAATLSDSKKADLQDAYDKLRQKFAEIENENSKLKKDLQKALDDGKKIKDELNELKQNEKKCKDRIDQLETDNSNLKKSLNKALDDLKKMGLEVAGIQGDESKLKQKVAMLETENVKLKKDLETALETARKASADALALKDENSKLKQRIAQLESENAKLKTDIDSTVNQLKKANDQAKLLQDENNRYKQKIGQLEDETSKLKQKLDAAIKEAKPAGAPDVGSRQRLEDELDRLRKELNGAKTEARDNIKELAQLNDENNRLKQKISQLEAENARLKKDLENSQNATKSAEAELSRLKDNEAKLKDKITQLNSDNGKLQKEKAALTDDVKRAGSDLAKLSELKDSENKLKQRIAQLETENAKLKKDLDAALSDAKRLGDELSNTKNENTKIKQELAKMESDNKKLKKEFDNAVAEAKKEAVGIGDLKEIDDKLKQRISQLETENTRLKSELENALDGAKQFASDLSKLRDQDNKLKQKVAQLEIENSKLKKDLEKALNDVQAGVSQAANLRNENNKLKQQISQYEMEIANLRKELEAALNDAKSKTTGMSKLQDEINNLKQKNSKLEKENDNLKKELETIIKDQKAESDRSKKIRDDNDKQKQKITQLEEELAKLKKELEAAKTLKTAAPVISKAPDDDDKRKQLEQLGNENAKLKRDLDNALKDAQKLVGFQDENSKLKQQVLKLQNEIDKLKNDLNTTLNESKKYAAELAKIKENESKLKQRIAQLETENLNLKKDLDDAKSRGEEVNSLRNENKKLRDQVKQLSDEINKLKTALVAAETKKEPVDETKNLKDEIAKLKQKIANLEVDNANLKQQYDEARTELQSTSIALKESDKLKETNNKLLAEVNNLKKQLENARTANQTLSDENGKLKKKIEQMEQELSKVKNLSDENGKLKKKVEQLEQALTKLKKELSDIKGDLLTAVGHLEKLRDENTKLKDENEKLQNDLKAIKNQLNNAVQTLEKFEGKDFEKQIKDYEAKVKQLEAELVKQKKECEETIKSLKAQFDRDIKNLLKKNEDNIDKLQREHADIIKDLNEKHDKEIKFLRDALDQLRAELEAALKENSTLRNLLEEQKRKSIDIKAKVIDVEKVISKERKRSKELGKKHSELESKTSVIEEKLLIEQRKSLEVQKERDDLSEKLEQVQRKKRQIEQETDIIKAENQAVAKEKAELESESKKLKQESNILLEALEMEKRKSKNLESDIKSLKKNLRAIPEEKEEKPKERKLKDEKLTMATFETVSLVPEVIAITAPLSDRELKFYGKKPCPCANNLDEILKKSAKYGLQGLTIEELQFMHKHLSDAAANILERMGQKTGVLRPTQIGDRLSLLRRIAELEGDLLRKQKQTQQKIAEMQNAVKLEKDRLSELRKKLEIEKHASKEVPRRQISRDVEALETMKNQLEQRLNEELLNKMKLEKKLCKTQKCFKESPVRDSPKECPCYTFHSTGKLQ